MTRIIEILVLMAILFLMAQVVSGCALLKATKGNNITVEGVPSPGEQLWTAARKSNWLVTLSILGIAAGVFALVNGATKLGTAAIASSSVSLFMALAVARFAMWMAVFGLIGPAAAALFSIFVRRKALIELIRGIQKTKSPNLIHSVNYVLSQAQSKSTKAVVSKLKSEMKLKGEI